PTALERSGDFSQSRNVFGRPGQLFDPATGQPFPGNVIPSGRIRPEAAALLAYYPQANISAEAGINFQTPTVTQTGQNAFTTRVTPYFANRTNVSGNAGITGNDQEPASWGPPTFLFASVSGLADALPNFNRTRTHGGGAELYWRRSPHNVTAGGDFRPNHVD